jgi:site-specific DNA-methyltransferase (adenine-specific)
MIQERYHLEQEKGGRQRNRLTNTTGIIRHTTKGMHQDNMTIDLRLGDCLEVLKTIPDNSIDSVVTDPPYGLGFMGKEWDTFDKNQFGNIPDECSDENVYNKKGFKTLPRYKTDGLYQFANDWAKECFRVLKPGGHLLSFAGSRTYHKICMGIEDAGFEIRDQIMWVYGSGFPKSHNIGKAIQKQSGDIKVIGTKQGAGTTGKSYISNNEEYVDGEKGVFKKEYDDIEINNDWEGWGTALKPAHEPIVMARKPLSEKSIAENVLKHGTGGINIDGSRIPSSENDKYDIRTYYTYHKTFSSYAETEEEQTFTVNEKNEQGRFPANIIFDEEAGQLLDEQSGISKSSKTKSPLLDITGGSYNNHKGNTDKITERGHNDKGGASRFFYCPKAAKSDRDEGLDNFEEKAQRVTSGGTRDFNARCASCGKKFVGSKSTICDCDNPITDNQVFKKKNNHPTVKPVDLMRYLINLVTPPNGTILDPFMGSGSTGKAAVRCGVNFIGIEKEQEYMEIASARIEHEKNKPVQTKLFDGKE